jgi:hypothetical protein
MKKFNFANIEIPEEDEEENTSANGSKEKHLTPLPNIKNNLKDTY